MIGSDLCQMSGCSEPAITELDGDRLCQKHADAWVRAEGQAQYEERQRGED